MVGFDEIMLLEPERLEAAYRVTMQKIIAMKLTLLSNGTFHSKNDGVIFASHRLTTILQQNLKDANIITVSNGTYRVIVENIVKQMIEYHLGDIDVEDQFPTFMR